MRTKSQSPRRRSSRIKRTKRTNYRNKTKRSKRRQSRKSKSQVVNLSGNYYSMIGG